MQKQKKRLLLLAALKEQHKDARAQRKKPEKASTTRQWGKESQLQQLDNEVHVTIMSGKMPTDNGNRPLKQPGAGGKLQCKHSTIKRRTKATISRFAAAFVCTYSFINAEGRYKSLSEIFDVTEDKTLHPGGGMCCAKLLQYAYLHDYKVLAMGEFWWGRTPPSEVRQHGRFYPACKSKREPILGHMLKGLNVAPGKSKTHKEIVLVREDEHSAIIHKPHGLLSVPGKGRSWFSGSSGKEVVAQAEGPMMVHRLDMDTSGLMIIAKTWQVYHHLQQQFCTTVSKDLPRPAGRRGKGKHRYDWSAIAGRFGWSSPPAGVLWTWQTGRKLV